MRRALLATLLAVTGSVAFAQIDGPPDAVRADRAIDRTLGERAPSSAAPEPAVSAEQNQRAVAGCLTDRGLPAELCRERRPNPDVPMSRAQSENLEQRYEGQPAPAGTRALEDATGRRPGAGP